MADLDDITQRILLEGDSEVINQLKEIGETGLESFEKLFEAIEGGEGVLTAFGNALATVVTGVLAAAAAVTAFVNTQDEAIQKTQFLATAFGATTAQLTGIEAAFAQAGVSTKSFEQFAQRLTTTIAREWPAITEAVRTGATEQSEANTRVQESILKVQEAQQNLSNVGERSNQTVIASALRVSEAYRTLQFAAQNAASEATHAFESVQGATLGLEAAEQRLATLQGRPPSAAAKQDLETKQAQLAVDQAQQAITDASLKQQEQAAAAADKQRKLQEDLASAQLKHATDIQNAENAQRQAELSVVEATNARASAEERADQVALKNIPAITGALQGLQAGNKAAAGAIDLENVSVQNLVKSIILLSSSGNGKAPEGLTVMHNLMELLHNDTDKAISDQQRLAIVQTLSQRGFNTTGQAAADLLHVLEQGKSVLDNYDQQAKEAFANSDVGKANVEELRQAYEKFSFTIELVSRNLAAMASPAISGFLNALTSSLSNSNGLLHTFLDGLSALSSLISIIITGYSRAASAIDNFFNLQSGTAFKIILEGVLLLIVAFAGPLAAIPAAITLIIIAAGELRDIWPKIKEAANDAWKAITDSAPFKFFASIIEQLTKILKLFGLISDQKSPTTQTGPDTNSAPTKPGAPLSIASGPDTAPGFAGGGKVNGFGSATSDSIPAWLSDGEFVQNAAAVRFWGEDFMHSINNMQFPGFATGGLVPAPSRIGSGRGGMSAQSVLNLTIGDRTFNGLSGPRGTIDDLSSYAVGRQAASAGRKPSWVK